MRAWASEGVPADRPVSGKRPGRCETALVAAISSSVANNSECLAALLAARPPPAQAARDEALLVAAKYGRADYVRTRDPAELACTLQLSGTILMRSCVDHRHVAGSRCLSSRAGSELWKHTSPVCRAAVRRVGSECPCMK